MASIHAVDSYQSAFQLLSGRLWRVISGIARDVRRQSREQPSVGRLRTPVNDLGGSLQGYRRDREPLRVVRDEWRYERIDKKV